MVVSEESSTNGTTMRLLYFVLGDTLVGGGGLHSMVLTNGSWTKQGSCRRQPALLRVEGTLAKCSTHCAAISHRQ